VSIVPASLVTHLALTSLATVAWAFLAIRRFRIRCPATRALVLTVAVLLPVVGLAMHLVYPEYCDRAWGVVSHLACVSGMALGRAGAYLLSVGLVVGTAQLTAGWMTHRGVLRGAVSVGSAEWQDPSLAAKVAGAISRASGELGKDPAVLVTEKPGICCSVGIFRPAVVISREFCRIMDDEELEAVLAHEFAHIERRDNLTGLLARIIRSLTFFSPAVHLAVGQYMYEREKAADDRAVRVTGNRLALASAIVKVARYRRGALSMSLTGGSKAALTERVRRLIDAEDASNEAGEDKRRVFGVSTAIAGIVAVTLLIC